MRGQAGPAAPRQRWQHCPMALPHVPAPAPAAQQAGPLARPGSRARRLVGGGVATLAVLACLPLWLQVLPQRNGQWIALLLPIHAAFALAWSPRARA